MVAEALDGTVTFDGANRASVTGTGLGEIKFKLDSRYAHPIGEDSGMVERALEGIGARPTAAAMLSPVVPVELITEPLSAGQFGLLDRAVAALGDAGALGTAASALYAFGVHLNVAVDEKNPERAIRIAAAYSFAERWLRERWAVNTSRRMVPFIDPYPKGWTVDLGKAMAEGRVPALEEFIQLYQVYNPSRNRGLDLWPLLGHFAPEAAERIAGQPVRNARPAFHYRWPDSRVGEPGWSPWRDYERWLLIEAVADRPELLERARLASVGAESGKGKLSDYMRVMDAVMAR